MMLLGPGFVTSYRKSTGQLLGRTRTSDSTSERQNASQISSEIACEDARAVRERTSQCEAVQQSS